MRDYLKVKIVKQIKFAGVPVELIEVNYDEISAEIQQNIIILRLG